VRDNLINRVCVDQNLELNSGFEDKMLVKSRKIDSAGMLEFVLTFISDIK
jgi:hypothetical protein